MSRLKQLLLFMLLIVLAVSCSRDDDEDVVNITLYKSDANSNVTNRLEVPKLLSGNKFIYHSTKVGYNDLVTYSLEYDVSKHHSRWVAFRFDAQTRNKNNSTRSDKWADDPNLEKQYQIGFGNFRGGVRGHLCASHDRRYNQEANDQTFYMTNISPMSHDFNGDYWTTFEKHVQELGRNSVFSDTLYIVKGGTIDQIKGYAYSSQGMSIVIPKYFFIALLKYKSGRYSSIGFWVEHKDYGRKSTNDDMKNAACSIDDLEKKTGIDFFHNLPDSIEDSIEKKLVINDWKL